MAKCDWCGKEVEKDKCSMLYTDGKLILAWWKKCDAEKKLAERIKIMQKV
jgi:hypothetical protein